MTADRFTTTPADAAEFEARNSAEDERDGDELDGGSAPSRGCCVGGECEGHPWAQPQAISRAGIYDVPEAEYHADRNLAPHLGRSLSSTGAKLLLRNPALFAYQRDHGQPPRDAFDDGHIAHRLILGTGADITVVDAYDWKTKAAQQERAAGRDKGLTVINRAQLLAASKMAAAVRRHPTARAILSEGKAEQSAYWIDERTGVTCRGRMDWLRDNAIADVKTCADASPEGFAKAVASFGYHQQADWYTTAVEATTGKRLPFIFVCVEKTAPHLVGVYTLDPAALSRGRRLNEDALDIYADHESNDSWPTSYGDDITELTLPRWAA